MVKIITGSSYRSPNKMMILQMDEIESIGIGFINTAENEIKAKVYLMNIYYERIGSPLVAFVKDNEMIIFNKNPRNSVGKFDSFDFRISVNQKIYNEIKPTSFIDICENEDYYEIEDNKRVYFIDQTYGYVPKNELNNYCVDCDFIDLNDIYERINNVKASHMMYDLFAACHIDKKTF